MHPNSKIFDFVNLTALVKESFLVFSVEIIDYPKLSFLIFSISRFLCLFLVIQFSRYFADLSAPFSNLFWFVVENKGLEPLTPCVQGRCSPS